MKTFKEFIGSQEKEPQTVVPSQESSTKWKATKEEIIEYWKGLRSDAPVLMRAIDYNHKGSTYGEDGIRITGSPQFIGSIISRMKELLAYESPTTKLAVTYRQTESPSKMAMGQSKTSYVFYVSARERGSGSQNTI
jgi:hypothetical protein